MVNIGDKLYLEDGTPCIVTDTWDEDKYHSAGFRADIHIGKRCVRNEEFKISHIGKCIYYDNKVKKNK